MNQKKIVLIGPVYPYKGGISHYTGLMYRALSEKYDVSMVSYKMQYPKLLFRKEQKDFANDTFKIENTKFWIHTANPLNWIDTARKIKEQRPDLIICQWWHPYFAPCYIMLRSLLGKTKWMFVCHNVFPHERFPMDRLLSKWTLQKGNYFIVQSKQDAEDLCSIIENPVYERTVHPTYNAFKFQNMSKGEARELLGINATEKILLFFGFVREYKGLKHLIKAMPDIVQKLPDTRLLIVGDFGSDKSEYMQLIEQSRIKDAVQIYDGYIPDREVEKYFAACDLVVLPYESATQSGIVQIAYGFEKPVIATNVGGLPDVVTDGKTGYLVKAQNPQKLGEAVVRFFQEGREHEFSENVKAEAYRFSWERMVEVVEKIIGW